MDSMEPLPKVTFLPAQLTELVIKNWTGDIIDFEKNGQICKVYHGQGTCEFREGHTFKGEMRHGLLHGKGEFVWVDGTRYKGEFRENEVTGTGRYDWLDGSFYEGQVANGLRHGSGAYTNPKEGVVYEGQWLNGLRHGQGVLRYKNGSVYEGSWEKGMKSGLGKMTYQSGNFYEGQWSLNKRNGEGTMHWLSSNEKYTGNWEDNFQSGFGTHIWLEAGAAQPQGDNKLLRNRYVGNWKGGLRSGQGTFYYSNGSKYDGEWRDNLKNGHGVFTFEDGTCYEGPFDNDRMVNRNIQGAAPPQAVNTAKDAADKTNKADSKATAADKSPAKANNSKVPGATNLNETVKTTTGAGGTTTGKFAGKISVAKREVEQNPFKALLDISDLIEMEGPTAVGGPKETEKEVQNIMLRNNSDLKAWYKLYSRKVEAQKSEESFSMTLRQVWRFLRDCQIIGPDCTLAQFNRIYSHGRKNHFSLQPKKGQESKKPSKPTPLMTGGESSSEEEEDEVNAAAATSAEDIHIPSKVVLQRQFFEALVRSASIKFANRIDLPTLADKVDFLFKSKLLPYATKSKAKSIEEEKQFKLAEKVLEEYEGQLREVFTFFGKAKQGSGVIDVTLRVEDAIEMCKKAGLIQGTDGKPTNAPLKIQEFIAVIERFYSPEQRLAVKLSNQDAFLSFIHGNPAAFPWSVETPSDDPEEQERFKAQFEQNKEQVRPQWEKQVISEHLVYLRGVEIIYFEFKELLFDLATTRLPRDLVDPKRSGKVRPVLTRFLDDHFLKRLGALIRHTKSQPATSQAAASRKWPESEKDKLIRLKVEERLRIEEEQRQAEAERLRLEEEAARELAEQRAAAMMHEGANPDDNQFLVRAESSGRREGEKQAEEDQDEDEEEENNEDIDENEDDQDY